MADNSKKPEMTAAGLIEKWGWPYVEEGWKMEDCTEELRADLLSVIRGKLVKYTDWLELIPLSDEVEATSEGIVDEFLSNNQ